ncbi:cystine/glutamate transporter [Strongylocentrotus purpuratus]|uniref:Cystine/glutamate transporter n=1 Tax=Strongylocentrotus purpuratus TaxID=7668 RepID=A0A7M7HP53_STRPU|nr:cystine/glutamate transporter [Strongylocentrotus purpuratus]
MTSRNGVAGDHDDGKGNDEHSDKVAIPRHLGLFGCIWHLVGLIIGTGIFISPTGVLRGAGGSVGLSFILWIVCAIIQTCGALSMAELAVIMKKSGGDFTFILQAWGPLMAFIRLWVLEMIIVPSGGAVMIMTISSYLLTPFFQCEETPVVSLRLLGVFFLLFIVVINCISVRLASKLAGVLSITKIVGLVIIIITGLHNLTKGKTEHFDDSFDVASYDISLLPTGLLSGLWAYSGWSVVTSISEEVKNPARNIPLSIVISMSMITMVYLMANVAYFTLLSPTQILTSTAVAADYSVQALGISWSWLIWLFVAMSALGSFNSSIFRSSRVKFSSAREGHLPEILSMVSISRNTPLPAILSCVLLLVYLIEDDIIALVEYLGFIDVVFESVTIAIVPYYRWKYPDIPRPYKVPLVIAFLYMAALVFIAVMALYAHPVRNSIALLTAFIAIPVYYAMVHPKYKLKCIRPISVKTTRFLQKLFYCVRQEKKTF